MPRSVSIGPTPPPPVSWSEAPSRITTIAVSPAIRPMPSAVPVAMPGRAAGSSTRRIVAALVLPSAYEASRTWRGIACSASRVAPTISGSAINAIIAPAVKNERPKTAPPSAVNDRKLKNCCENRIRPKIASTMLGVPATTSTADSTARASQNGRAYSRQPDRGRDPGHDRQRRAHHGQQERSDQRVEEAAGLALVELCLRVAERAGRAARTGARAPACRSRSRPRARTAGSPPPSTAQSRSGRPAARTSLRVRGGRAAQRSRPPSDSGSVLLHRLLRGPARQRQEHRRHQQHRRERVQRLAERLDRQAVRVVDDRRRERARRLEEEREAVERVRREARPSPRPSTA